MCITKCTALDVKYGSWWDACSEGVAASVTAFVYVKGFYLQVSLPSDQIL